MRKRRKKYQWKKTKKKSKTEKNYPYRSNRYCCYSNCGVVYAWSRITQAEDAIHQEVDTLN